MIKAVSITIKTIVQRYEPTNKARFSIGKVAKNALEIKDGDNVLLTIRNESCSVLFRGIKKLISGEEIYDKKDENDLIYLNSGQKITVTIDKLN